MRGRRLVSHCLQKKYQHEKAVLCNLFQNSFIHVEDFQSARHLAAYLTYLDRNTTAYSQYFQWRGRGQMFDVRTMCRVCNVLNFIKLRGITR